MLAEIRDAEDRDHAPRAVNALAHEFGAKWPKAVAKVLDDVEELLAFYDFPPEHWIHLKTSNAIESTFSTVRLRTRVTKGSGSRAAGLAMAFKLLEAAQQRWRSVNAPNLVALVWAGAKFEKGVLIERPSEQVTDAVALAGGWTVEGVVRHGLDETGMRRAAGRRSGWVLTMGRTENAGANSSATSKQCDRRR